MKKLVLAVFAVVSLGSIQAIAQNAVNNATTVVASEDQKEVIDVTALPEPVKKTLATDAYAGWKASEAAHVKTADTEYYEVTLAKGEEKKQVKFDKDGKAV